MIKNIILILDATLDAFVLDLAAATETYTANDADIDDDRKIGQTIKMKDHAVEF